MAICARVDERPMGNLRLLPNCQNVVVETNKRVGSKNCENHEDVNEKVQNEKMLVNMSVPCHTMLLSDPYVWLPDKAATAHTTLYLTGLIATKGVTMGGTITVGNVTQVAASVVGEISGIMCNQYGVEIGAGMPWEVSHFPDGKYNWFSVSWLKNEGWLLHGDKGCMWMTKERKPIVFDIKILTSKGAVYAMYFKQLSSMNGELATGMIYGRDLKLTINWAHTWLGHIEEDAV